MNSRERFITTIKGGEPDRPPVFANFTPQVAEKMSKHLGLPYEEPMDSMLSTRISHTNLLLHLGNDAVGTSSIAPINAPTVNNPIQHLAKDMAPEFLKNEFGKDLIFFGGICVQELLPNGSTQQIKDEIKRRVEILGKGGGYILAPAHNIQDDTSVENVLAFFEAVHGL